MYFVLIVKTLQKYGTRMDLKWKQKVMEWVTEDMTVRTILKPGDRGYNETGPGMNGTSGAQPRPGFAPVPEPRPTSSYGHHPAALNSDLHTRTTPFSGNAAILANEASNTNAGETLQAPDFVAELSSTANDRDTDIPMQLMEVRMRDYRINRMMADDLQYFDPKQAEEWRRNGVDEVGRDVLNFL